jgi:ABC-type protease/lipase transport system fused ATPase/permease subunit
VRLPLKIGGKGEGTQPIRDLDNVRGFLSGSGPVAFFDLPWMPVYLAICFLFHTLIGLTALFGAIVLVVLTIVTEINTRHPTRSAAQFAAARNALLEASRRNAEAITAMGMVGRIAKHWHELNRNFVATSGRASDVGGGLGAASKVLRLLLQSAILAVGAWLVINQQSTPGIIIRRIDSGLAGSGAGRSGDRQLARFRRRPAELAATVQAARAPAAQGRSDAAKAAVAFAGRSKRRGGAARRSRSQPARLWV